MSNAAKKYSFSSESPILYVMNSLKEDYSHEMLNVRRDSKISGPLNKQNPLGFYKTGIKTPPHIFQGLAIDRRDQLLVGYVHSHLYKTRPMRFGMGNTYQPFIPKASQTLRTDNYLDFTLTINEICVRQQNQGLGIAANLLDMMLLETRKLVSTAISAVDGHGVVKNVEFTIMASNISSELLFTSFSQRHGDQVEIGSHQASPWGNYISWSLQLSSPLTHALGESKKLKFISTSNSQILDRLISSHLRQSLLASIMPSSIFSSGLLDRIKLIERSRLRQTSRFG